jgi:hypothetical protein
VPHAAKVDTAAEQEQRSVTGGLFDFWIPVSCVSCTSWFLRRGQLQNLSQAASGVPALAVTLIWGTCVGGRAGHTLLFRNWQT